MYGLPADTDLSFLRQAQLIQVCVGQNEVILNLTSRISIMVASAVRLVFPDGAKATFDEASQRAPALPESAPVMLSLLGSVVSDVSIVPPGTLRLTWSSGHVMDIIDSWEHYESYTISNGDDVIVV